MIVAFLGAYVPNGSAKNSRVPSDLDATFSRDGKVTTTFSQAALNSSRAFSVAIQRDGKILACGDAVRNERSEFGLVRYRPSGTLDPSFSGNGKVRTRFGGSGAMDLVVQSNGRIVVVGQAVGDPDDTPDNSHDDLQFAVARYMPDGELDRSFSGNGKVWTKLHQYGSEATAVELQPNGKIVVAGRAFEDFAVARYNPDGSLDRTFGGETSNDVNGAAVRRGIVTTDFGGEDTASDLALRPDGKVIVAGTADADSEHYGDLALARYDADGGLDPTFSDGGTLVYPVEDGSLIAQTEAVALQRDGRILVSGTGGGRFAVARLLPDGSLDPSFSEDGRVQLFSGGANDIIQLKDGRILAAGDNGSFVLVALNPDGSPDQSSYRNGMAGATFFGRFRYAHSVANELAVQRDGKVVLAGYATAKHFEERFALARFTAP